MDQQIKLRNKETEQECAFDDQSQADHFLANVEHKKDWAPATDEAPAAAPAPAADEQAAIEQPAADSAAADEPAAA